MPNWKKVIVSGSNAALNSLTVATNVVAQSFTGSLFGTSSFANNATSASYALSASYASSAQNASDILVYVKNSSGAQINKGKVVRIVGAVGDNPLIATASYEDDNNSANTLGITNENIANDSFGYVMTEGTLLGIDTSAFTAGQLIYLGATGSITGSAPVAPLHAVRLGEVLRVQLNNGSIYVRVDNGYELGELHDVRDTTTTGSYGDLLVKSGSIWINSRQLTGSYGLTGSLQATSFTGSLKGTSSFAVETITATTSSHAISALSASYALTSSNIQGGTANYISIWKTATTLSSSAFYQDPNNNNYIGLFTTVPTYSFDVNGTVRSQNDFRALTKVYFPGLVNTPQTNVVVWDTAQGELFYQSTSSLLVNTASYALTASSATIFNISSSLYSAQGTTAGIGTTVVASISTGSYKAGFFDYTVYNTGNARAGTVASAWNNSTVVYSDTSTTDIGSTNSVTMSVALNGGNVELRTTAGTTWTVKTTYRLI